MQKNTKGEHKDNMMERILKADEMAYLSMEMVAKMLEHMSPNGAKYVVRDVYLDYGQGWMWTTICREGFRECQVLNPREWKEIVVADNFWELDRIAKEIREDKFFGDK